jgi:hypothetical protein
MIEARPGLRAMPFPPGVERVVSMINYKDRLLVATDAGVYELVDGAWSRMAFVEAVPSGGDDFDICGHKERTDTDGQGVGK